MYDRDRVPVILSAAMDSSTYHVQADWDPEANVWVATSDDVPGLATEAATIEELTARLRTLIPELLENSIQAEIKIRAGM